MAMLVLASLLRRFRRLTGGGNCRQPRRESENCKRQYQNARNSIAGHSRNSNVRKILDLESVGPNYTIFEKIRRQFFPLFLVAFRPMSLGLE